MTTKAHATTVTVQPPISQNLAAEILDNQANEVQAIAREFVQQGYQVADLALLQGAGRVVVVTGTLLERLGSARHESH